MNVERRIRSILYPVTSPHQRRRLIQVRNRAVGAVADIRGRFGDRPLPDFVVGGVQKGGTTFLFHELLRHPDVSGPLTKEVHFFDVHFERGTDWYRGMFPRRRDDRQMLYGEASPAYIFRPDAIRRLSEVLPDVTLVIVLRDPVKRALSNYSHERRLGYEPCETFEEALALEEERVAEDYELVRTGQLEHSFAVGHFAYRRRGHYLEQLEHAASLLGKERVHVVISEHMFADPQATVRSVLDVIGAPAWDVPPPNENDMKFPSESMLESTTEMLREYFREPNARLAEYLGVELPWS